MKPFSSSRLKNSEYLVLQTWLRRFTSGYRYNLLLYLGIYLSFDLRLLFLQDYNFSLYFGEFCLYGFLLLNEGKEMAELG